MSVLAAWTEEMNGFQSQVAQLADTASIEAMAAAGAQVCVPPTSIEMEVQTDENLESLAQLEADKDASQDALDVALKREEAFQVFIAWSSSREDDLIESKTALEDELSLAINAGDEVCEELKKEAEEYKAKLEAYEEAQGDTEDTVCKVSDETLTEADPEVPGDTSCTESEDAPGDAPGDTNVIEAGSDAALEVSTQAGNDYAGTKEQEERSHIEQSHLVIILTLNLNSNGDGRTFSGD